MVSSEVLRTIVWFNLRPRFVAGCFLIVSRCVLLSSCFAWSPRNTRNFFKQDYPVSLPEILILYDLPARHPQFSIVGKTHCFGGGEIEPRGDLSCRVGRLLEKRAGNGRRGHQDFPAKEFGRKLSGRHGHTRRILGNRSRCTHPAGPGINPASSRGDPVSCWYHPGIIMVSRRSR